MRGLRARAVVFVALCALAPTSTAWAQRVDAQTRRANALRRRGRDAEALAIFEALYRRSPTAATLARLALTEGALSRWVDAEAHLTEALSHEGDPFIAAHRDELSSALTRIRAQLAEVTVETELRDAEVFVDGRRAGRADGTPLRLAPGDVRVELRPTAGVPRSRVVSLRAGERTALRFDPPATTLPAEPLARVPVVDVLSTVSVAPAPRRAAMSRAPAAVTLAAGAAVLVGGVTALVFAHRAADDYNDDPACPGVSAPSQPEACGSRVATAETLQVVGWVGVGVGAAAAVAGAVWLGRASSRRERARVECGPTTGTWGLRCGLRF